MLILVCALTLALAIGCCVGGLMVQLRADRGAVVRRGAVPEPADKYSPRSSPRRSPRPTGRLEEPPASRS
jgi:hypothetical protein